VSYGLRPIVKLNGTDSLFNQWIHSGKTALADENDTELLREYVDFCVKEINVFISAIRASLPKDKWSADKAVAGRLLTTTNINGWIICLRKIIECPS